MKVLTREIEIEEVNMFKMPVGLYEKSLPPDLSWSEYLAAAGQASFDFKSRLMRATNACPVWIDLLQRKQKKFCGNQLPTPA